MLKTGSHGQEVFGTTTTRELRVDELVQCKTRSEPFHIEIGVQAGHSLGFDVAEGVVMGEHTLFQVSRNTLD